MISFHLLRQQRERVCVCVCVCVRKKDGSGGGEEGDTSECVRSDATVMCAGPGGVLRTSTSAINFRFGISYSPWQGSRRGKGQQES